MNELLAVVKAEMIRLAKELPEYETVHAMFGVGELLAAQLMAEIGDIRNYPRRSSLVGFAGVDPEVNQSGKMNSESNPSTKRGSPHLVNTKKREGFNRMVADPLFFCNSAVQGDNAAFGRIRTLIAQLVKNSADQQQGYELRNCACVFELMDVLYNNFQITRSHAQDAQNHRYSVRIAQIARLIREHHTESLSLSQLAEMVRLSAPYLSKFFDQQFGMCYNSITNHR